MNSPDVKILLRSYLGDTDVNEDLVDEIEGFLESSYCQGFDAGYDTRVQEEEEGVYL